MRPANRIMGIQSTCSAAHKSVHSHDRATCQVSDCCRLRNEMIGQAQTHDVLIVGAGPAGLATAILASRKGFRVLVVDHAHTPIDKACGEGLLPDTVASLRTLGVSFHRDEAVPLRGIRFLDVNNGLTVEAAFPQCSGLGVRRTVLHAKMLQCAVEVDVSFAWGARVTGIGAEDVACDGLKIHSRWVIGADGENSQVRKWIFPHRPRREQIRFGCRRHFQRVPWTDFVEVYWGPSCQITVTPVGPEEICLAMTSRSSRMKLKDALLEVPELAERVAGSLPASREQGTAAALRYLRVVRSGRFALVGDASGSVDPVTGEGLGLAFRQAHSLTDALRANDLRLYQAAHTRIGRIPRLLSRLILLMDSHPQFRKRVMRTLACEPSLFLRLLNVHIQALAPWAFGARNVLHLVRGLLASPSGNLR